ncbi:MAG: sulfurtransferase TusA family protein [Carboxydocellales bacterium]
MDIRIAATLDITGDRCPMTFVKVKLNLEELLLGDILEVFLKGEEPLENVPRSLKQEGQTVLLLEDQGERHRMLVRKEK